MPLIVKAAGQRVPVRVDEPRSNGQIAATVAEQAGADVLSPMAPPLGRPLSAGPFFATVKQRQPGRLLYPGPVDPDPTWADDLAVLRAANPYAVGLPDGLLGGPVPEGSRMATDVALETSEGDSGLHLVIAEASEGTCVAAGSARPVSVDGVVVGSIAWAPHPVLGGGMLRGWGIVPRGSDPEVWCSGG